jgi:hypothetical protein
MTSRSAALPALPGPFQSQPAPRVALSFRPGYAAERLSERELEALGPVLPELVAELLTIMALDSERG